MSTAKVFSCGLTGINGFITEVEADASGGLPSFDIVGLPDTAVKEAKERVRAAIKNCGYTLPSKKYTLNLAPARIRKEGTHFDLPIAVAVLACTEQCKKTEDYVLIGELSLAGEVRPVRGILPMVTDALKEGFKKFILPFDNAEEAALSGAEVFGVKTLADAVNFIKEDLEIAPQECNIEDIFNQNREYEVDFSEVHGQENVKRAVEIAAAGGHNLLMVGAPGSGKSMIAKRIPTILPEMSVEEAIEVTKIYSTAGILPDGKPLVTQRPFRAPHHTVSAPALAGGGNSAKPGELSLSHNGVLFLDELPEFSRSTSEVLRQPMEDGFVTVTRVNATCTYPCKTMVVCAMNPCKCGYYGDSMKPCRCSEGEVHRYLSRVSGPLLDRLDIQVEVPRVTYSDLRTAPAESSADIKKRVEKARKIQLSRYKDSGIYCNAQLSGEGIDKFCTLTEIGRAVLEGAFESMAMSARAYSRILKVARTIADLEGKENIDEMHIAEAIQYRSLDKKILL